MKRNAASTTSSKMRKGLRFSGDLVTPVLEALREITRLIPYGRQRGGTRTSRMGSNDTVNAIFIVRRSRWNLLKSRRGFPLAAIGVATSLFRAATARGTPGLADNSAMVPSEGFVASLSFAGGSFESLVILVAGIYCLRFDSELRGPVPL